ncbi:hypothetical protein HPP92_014915 [Vanilla planifolia]|uniref:Sugar phosphate transporter domain-containing protein n=1 Tax=Vanilla planifolia TaxID=51239 RepID=A0A835QSG5_VANPL|nr:hypothetical protein HPP92_014915 [Vanilla planifolia]
MICFVNADCSFPSSIGLYMLVQLSIRRVSLLETEPATLLPLNFKDQPPFDQDKPSEQINVTLHMLPLLYATPLPISEAVIPRRFLLGLIWFGVLVMDAKGETFLALFPAKFQRSFWIKKGSFVVVDDGGKEKALESGNKIACIVSQVLFHGQLRALEKSPDWPAIFKNTRAEEPKASPLRPESDHGDEPKSDSEDDLPPLEANLNRSRPFELSNLRSGGIWSQPLNVDAEGNEQVRQWGVNSSMGVIQRFQLGTVGALTLSVVSSVSIVICNKALISSLGFTFATTLTSWHLLVTFCSLHLALWMELFEHKPFDPRAVMGFGILNGCSIGLLNLSLGFNSVGFYQMTKLAIIPCTVLLETFFFRKNFSRNIQFSLFILLLGVGIATVTDLQLNILGSILSLLAILTTCIAQIMTNTIQKRFKVSSTQLLYQSCPYQAITLFVVGPFLDGLLTKENVFAFKYTPLVLVFIILSCLISVSVNFSTFLVIGKTSPVTYQVLGHLKTCLVLAFGYVLLHDPFSWRNITGIFVAVVGMVLYSYYCTTENQQKTNEAPVQLLQAEEAELDPLLGVEKGANMAGNGAIVAPNAPVWSSNKDLQA